MTLWYVYFVGRTMCKNGTVIPSDECLCVPAIARIPSVSIGLVPSKAATVTS